MDEPYRIAVPDPDWTPSVHDDRAVAPMRIVEWPSRDAYIQWQDLIEEVAYYSNIEGDGTITSDGPRLWRALVEAGAQAESLLAQWEGR